MRLPALAIAVLFGVLLMGAPAAPASASVEASPAVAAAVQQPPAPDVDIRVRHEGSAWYTSPVWLAIGAIALVVLVMLVVLASRGGGTTIVRE